jgi:small subunit ribosomal protein S2
MSVVDIKELFAAGAHFGHKTSRWHPKMRPFIHSERGGLHVIDLTKTVEMLKTALAAVTEIVSHGRQVLLVSTKTQAKEPIIKAAAASGMPYIANRWLGGQLTNFKTISKRIKHLKDLEKRMESGELVQRYSKLEVQRFQEEIDALNEQFGGIKEMAGLPGAIFIVDIVKDDIAVKEARKLNIPVIAMVDSNADPSIVDYPIACNDDAIKSIELILSYLSAAIADGKAGAKAAKPEAEAETEVKPETKPPLKKQTVKKTEEAKKPAKATPKPAAKKPTSKQPTKEAK